jgi:hypothetical protein
MGIETALIVGAAASVASGAMSAKAAKKAASTQAKSVDRAAELNNEQFQQTREDMRPYREVGQSGLYRLADLLGIEGNPANNPQGSYGMAQPTQEQFTTTTPTTRASQVGWNGGQVWGNVPGPNKTSFDQAGYDAAMEKYNASYTPGVAQKPDDYGSLLKDFTGKDLENEPGYQFRLNQGTKALDRSAAAKGNLYSGGTLKAAQRYGQDYASNEYGNAYNRDLQNRQSKYNFLAGISGVGQTATSQVGQIGANTAAVNSDLITSGGAARAAGIVGQSNAMGGALNQAAGGFQNYALLKNLYSQSGNV